MTQKPILVLGANGFIGRSVVASLACSNWARPILGTRQPPSSVNDRYERRTVEATSVESVAAAIGDVNGIVHCVAGDSETIVKSATALFEAANGQATPPRIIYLSSMAVYGSATGLIDEITPMRGDIGPYSEAKVAAEELARDYPQAVVFRPGCVFGPGSEQWSVRIAKLLQARRLGDLGLSGDGYCNLVHVNDVAQAVILALESPQTAGRSYNLSLANPPTWNEYLIQFAIALGAVPVRRITSRRLKIETKLLAPPLKIAEILVGKIGLGANRLPPPIPPSLARVMSHDIRLDTRRIESDLGLRWRDFDASLRETASWLAGRQN